ncbi:ATP-binding cassette domain-containing protein [Phycicoccus sp. CSK15P-2]|uniref:ATP-binding cassette domain-containing protein n=1 Tax=Phycicoccus sp. CSK15P-2 TaxID=2807627 RepID=UPI00194FAEE1|nr:ATP-binding cassette domain-containing protein [Phycicoccus sp. CSK15P-2]MBM6403278.1 ATP-binding cassette domain-containing protein [Phycicoccus sp. CSK15P-2]
MTNTATQASPRPLAPHPGSGSGHVNDIRARGLTKRYGRRTVVDDLSFRARPGVVTGFLGPNGAGKSTTLRMLLGLAAPSAGDILVGGTTVGRLADPARTIGALLDARALHPRRTAADHLLAFAAAAGLGRARVDEVLGLVGLDAMGGRRAGELSLGMQQRLGIATALLGDPGVLVLDEPLNGLDPDGIRWLRTLMRGLAAEGRTVLFSSHLMSEMELTAHDLVVIGRGRLIAESPLEELIRTHTHPQVVVRTPDPADLARALERAGLRYERPSDGGFLLAGLDTSTVGRVAAAEGIPLDELAAVRESLEDVFLRLTDDAADHEGGRR